MAEYRESGEMGNTEDMGRAWIETDMDNLSHNVSVVRGRLPDSCRIMASVKADAYGLGAVNISRKLNALGVRAFCVASAPEGVELRRHGIEGEILVLGYTHPGLFPLLPEYGLTQTVLDLEYAELLNNFGEKLQAGAVEKLPAHSIEKLLASVKEIFPAPTKENCPTVKENCPAFAKEKLLIHAKEKLPVHVKVDTGLRRLGEPSENTDRIMRIFECENLAITGIYTHFCAENNGDAGVVFTQEQVERFKTVCDEVARREVDRRGVGGAAGYYRPKVHAQNSYGIFNRPDLAFDYARTGRAIYGILGDIGGADKYGVELWPVLSLKARISTVKTVASGEYIGYGFAYAAPRDMKIAVLSIGYADGLPRSLSHGVGNVLIDGCKAPIIGWICMDLTLVDVTGIENVARGDTAVIIGKSGEAEITAGDVAEQTGTISTEILSRLGGRLARHSPC